MFAVSPSSISSGTGTSRYVQLRYHADWDTSLRLYDLVWGPDADPGPKDDVERRKDGEEFPEFQGSYICTYELVHLI
jgi:hypothetical protein